MYREKCSETFLFTILQEKILRKKVAALEPAGDVFPNWI